MVVGAQHVAPLLEELGSTNGTLVNGKRIDRTLPARRRSPLSMIHPLVRRRLHSQRLATSSINRPAELVAWLGAVQAQEFGPANWAIGLRMRAGTTADAVRRAIDEGRILRTHVLRPTWHFVAADDIRWMLELTGPRVLARMAPYNRTLELDAKIFTRGTAAIERALADGRHLTRRELREALQARGISAAGTRLAHLAMYAELEGVICSGPRRGKQSTYGLIADRAPHAVRLSADEALATLAERFYRSHGPATIRDFVWWSGLTSKDARRGLEMIGAKAEEVDQVKYWSAAGTMRPSAGAGPVAHLLPIYDEYLNSYRDRVLVPHSPAMSHRSFGGDAAFQHALVVSGRVAGTWRVTTTASSTNVRITPLRTLTRVEQRAVREAGERYASFLRSKVELSIA